MILTKRSSSPPQAFSIQPSNKFDSYDGSWSTFNLNVGSTGNFQAFRFLPSTSSFSTWLPNAQGCNFTASDFSDQSQLPADVYSCASSRGVGNYNGNQSTGFIDSNPIGEEKLQDLGQDLTPANVFGSDYADLGGTLSLESLSLNSALASSTSEIDTSNKVPVYSIQTWDYYLPTLGLGIGNLVLGQNDTYSSALSVLAATNATSSLSWGYTAGTSYSRFALSPTCRSHSLQIATLIAT